jgi:hypothetical protein
VRLRPYMPRLALAILDGPIDQPLTPVEVAAFHELLDTLPRVNAVYLRDDPSLPRFYDAVARGLVRYVDPGRHDDPYSDLIVCLASGIVDCEDASGWVVADYRVRGGRPRARCAFTVEPTADGRRGIHIGVDPTGAGRYDRLTGQWIGTFEDPSKAAGMR